MLQCSFSFAAAQVLVKMTSALQKSRCCSAVSAARQSEDCSATSVFACGMLQGWGLEGWGLGLAEDHLYLLKHAAGPWDCLGTKRPPAFGHPGACDYQGAAKGGVIKGVFANANERAQT